MAKTEIKARANAMFRVVQAIGQVPTVTVEFGQIHGPNMRDCKQKEKELWFEPGFRLFRLTTDLGGHALQF